MDDRIESSMNSLRLCLAQLLTALMILAGMLVGFHYDWPDNVHTDYGAPLLWATHTESAFTGPVDIWRVSVTNLIANIAVWTVVSLALTALINLKQKSK